MFSKRFLMSLLAVGLLSCSMAACGDNDNNDGVRPKLVKSSAALEVSNISDDALAGFVKDQYDLNFELLSASEEKLAGKNAMISTFSIQTALGMV